MGQAVLVAQQPMVLVVLLDHKLSVQMVILAEPIQELKVVEFLLVIEEVQVVFLQTVETLTVVLLY
jgi:hypothetical protein